MGTPGFMAPEQALGKVADMGPASDIYALGAILYNILTLAKPIKAPGSIRSIEEPTSEPQISEPIALPQSRIEIPSKPPTSSIPKPEPKSQFHKSLARTRTPKKAGRIKPIEGSTIIQKEVEIVAPSQSVISSETIAVQEAPPRVLESFSVGPRRRKRRR